MFLKGLIILSFNIVINAGNAFSQQKQLVRLFEDAEKRPQTVRNFTDRLGCMPEAVFLWK